MSSSVIAKQIHDIVTVHTTVSPSGTLAAHTGGSVTITPTAPSGYKFLTHVATWNVGVIGLVASFDGNGKPLESAVVYQNNTTNGTVYRGTVNLLSLYYK